MEHICKNCGTKHTGSFCNNCGQKVIKGKFKLSEIIKEAIETTFNLDKGFFFTIYQLVINPKKVITDYLSGKTRIYINPIKFIIVIAGLSALVLVITKSIDRNIEITNSLFPNAEMSVNQLKVIGFFKSYINILMMLIVPFYTLGYRFFFLRKELNYTEHLIINCYAFGLGAILSIFNNIVFSFFPSLSEIEMILGFIIQLVIYTYFYYKLTTRNLVITTFFSIISMMIGLLLMFFGILSLTFIIISLLKNISVI
jgi:hypothetical protein